MRKFWINIHLYIASFFAPMLVIVALSGGLYLIGEKGSITKSPVALTSPGELDINSESLEDDVRGLLANNNIDHDFEYLKISGNVIYTRPTSTDHYEFNLSESSVAVSLNEPDWQKRLIELHKGHGPLMFKDLQKIMALGLLIVLVSGVWLGLSSSGLRLPTIAVTGAGLLVFVITAFL